MGERVVWLDQSGWANTGHNTTHKHAHTQKSEKQTNLQTEMLEHY